jgi:hypothetical protein
MQARTVLRRTIGALLGEWSRSGALTPELNFIVLTRLPILSS